MLKVWKVTFLLVTIAILASIPAAISAQTESSAGASKMYLAVSTTRTIQRANLDGSQLEELTRYIGPGRGGFTDIVLDVAAGKMYWSVYDADNDGTGRILRANLDGSQSETLITGSPRLTRPSGLALDVGAGKMYWGNTFLGDEGTSSIQRANLDGSQIEDLITSGLSWPRELDLDVAAGKMYWVDADKIQRANLDGSEVEDLVVTGLAGPLDIALDVTGGKMYWVDIETEKIQRANLDGSQVEDLVVAGLGAPISIALDVAAGKMYWTDVDTNKIQRANLDGSQVEDLTTSFTASAIALDVASVPATGPGPGTGTGDCSQAITADGTVSGSWASGCDSEARSGSHARYYSFTLAESSEVTVTLNSSAADTYLYLRSGDATSGTALYENDDHDGSTSVSQIQETLAAGSYTVEATTNSASATGSFSLTITVEDLLTVNVSRAAGSEDAEVRLGSPISLTATFSGPVSGFTVDDINVGNGTVSNFAGSGAVYTFDVTPDDIGEVTVEIAAGAVEDADGIGNTASPQFSLGIPYDDDDDGAISKNEAIAAVVDYFASRITKAQTISVIVLYFSTPAEPEPSDDCIQTVTSDGTLDGQWGSGCDSEARSGSHARYYRFTLDASSEVTVTLESSAVDTHLYLRSGDATSGTALHENDDHDGNTSVSQIQETLAAGSYTVEATTYSAGATGAFSLTISGLGGTTAAGPGPGTPEGDRAALIALYNATGGPNWEGNNNWLSDVPISEWSGVTTGDNGRVTGLNLGGNQLSGEIPPELGNLANLKLLYLNANQLSGEIPPELGNLANLELLYLAENQLSGEIPPELDNLANLKWLRLEGNQLSGGIPPELDNLANLELLYLAENQLSGEIPPELGNLANLIELYLAGNQLSGEIPPELGNLANLKSLVLSRNQLSGEIPPDLANLDRLHLSWNQLTGEIPPELDNLANLKWLGLEGNQLSGEIPPELGNLANLEGLHLEGNQLSGEIPPELGNLANLIELFLYGNQLTGEIPPELGNLANLKWLYLYGNQLSGGIPPELGNLANLQELFLDGNELSGGIPPELGNLANLEGLRLDGNQLSGCVPSSLSGRLNMDFSNLGGLPFCP